MNIQDMKLRLETANPKLNENLNGSLPQTKEYDTGGKNLPENLQPIGGFSEITIPAGKEMREELYNKARDDVKKSANATIKTFSESFEAMVESIAGIAVSTALEHLTGGKLGSFTEGKNCEKEDIALAKKIIADAKGIKDPELRKAITAAASKLKKNEQKEEEGCKSMKESPAVYGDDAKKAIELMEVLEGVKDSEIKSILEDTITALFEKSKHDDNCDCDDCKKMKKEKKEKKDGKECK